MKNLSGYLTRIHGAIRFTVLVSFSTLLFCVSFNNSSRAQAQSTVTTPPQRTIARARQDSPAPDDSTDSTTSTTVPPRKTSTGTRARPAVVKNAAPRVVGTRRNSVAATKAVKKVDPVQSVLDQAVKLGRQGNYPEASIRLYNVLLTVNDPHRQAQIRYMLGLMLYQMKLYQTASFQFVEIVKQGNNPYIKKALEKLSLSASVLNDESVLNFALSKMSLDDFPSQHRDVLYYRIGEVFRQKNDFAKAVEYFRKVSASSSWYTRARYEEGLAYAEMGKVDEALTNFNDLLEARNQKSVTDTTKVAAQLAIARTYYQKQNWEAAIEAYRQIPRDTELWHDALFEISWAYLRAAQFRSVLSNMHSLHSPYYEDFYNPESVLLRSIVYLYICKYDEMEKTLDFFERKYRPVQQDLKTLVASPVDAAFYYDEIARASEQLKDLKKNNEKRRQYKIPFIVARSMMRDGKFRNSYLYIQKLNVEKRQMNQEPARWKGSALGLMAERSLSGRLAGARDSAGKEIMGRIDKMGKELDVLFEQQGFARYEMLRGRKEVIKKEIAQKGLDKDQVDADNARSYYVQNGYEYWPFKGEYWLDEIGNYHYLGVQSCE